MQRSKNGVTAFKHAAHRWLSVRSYGAATASQPSSNGRTAAISDSPDRLTSATSGRSLYRALLRECSYFPDKYARRRLEERVKWQFRPGRFDALGLAMTEERLYKYRKEGWQMMRGIQRANSGDKEKILRCLALAYARIGRRRRQILNFITLEQDDYASGGMQADSIGLGEVQADSDASREILSNSAASGHNQLSSATSSGYDTGTAEPYAKVKPVSPLNHALQALVKSQNHIFLRRNVAFHIKSPGKLYPNLPTLNAWHKPMPESRIKNKTAQWKARLLERLSVPIPVSEWLDLHDLIKGLIPTELPKQRRSHPSAEIDLLDIVVQRHRFHDQTFTTRPEVSYDHRKMQRSWIAIFSASPIMRYDPVKKQWQVTWGSQALNDPELVNAIRADHAQGVVGAKMWDCHTMIPGLVRLNDTGDV